MFALLKEGVACSNVQIELFVPKWFAKMHENTARSSGEASAEKSGGNGRDSWMKEKGGDQEVTIANFNTRMPGSTKRNWAVRVRSGSNEPSGWLTILFDPLCMSRFCTTQVQGLGWRILIQFPPDLIYFCSALEPPFSEITFGTSSIRPLRFLCFFVYSWRQIIPTWVLLGLVA
ncbi:hypothetical protein CPC08DRAFT_315232 [Agrocybe pediades]|nr:hypothetical protein CPC08DRAFT_315232 [Agrocybe pediades]